MPEKRRNRVVTAGALVCAAIVAGCAAQEAPPLPLSLVRDHFANCIPRELGRQVQIDVWRGAAARSPRRDGVEATVTMDRKGNLSVEVAPVIRMADHPSAESADVVMETREAVTSETCANPAFAGQGDYRAARFVLSVATISNLEMLRRKIALHFEECLAQEAYGWVEASRQTVEIYLRLDTEGFVRESHIVQPDPTVPTSELRRRAEEIARSALAPKCSPVGLPRHMYDEEWSEILIQIGWS